MGTEGEQVLDLAEGSQESCVRQLGTLSGESGRSEKVKRKEEGDNGSRSNTSTPFILFRRPFDRRDADIS